MAKKRAAVRTRKPREPKLPDLNPNKAPVTSAGRSAVQMRDMTGEEKRAANRAARGRNKPPQIKKGQDTRPMVQRRFEAESRAEAGTPTGAPVVKKAEAGLSRWQSSVSANPGRAKKPWKNKSKASGKKGSTKALDKSKDSGVVRGSNAQALKAAGKKGGKKAKGATIKSSKRAKR